MRIAIYGRKSVFTGRGDSIENQIVLCRRYACERITGGADADFFIYEDEGFSGKNMRRPQFQQMMETARGQPFDYIICYRLDRISRSVSDFAPFVEELIGQGIAFVCIKEQFDTSTPMGKAMMYIASVFAQLERETIAERVRDNMYQLARGGRWLGGTPPLGFRSERVTQAGESGHKKSASRLVEQREELLVVREIYQLFIERQSLSAVAKALHRRSHTRQGGRFTPQSLRELLQNPVYCAADADAYAYFAAQGAQLAFSAEQCQPERGLLAYGKREASGRALRRPVDCWILAVGQHDGVLSGRDWVRVQELLAQNRSISPEKAPHNAYALFSGLLRCGLCGGRMFAKRRQNRIDRFDYICEHKLRGGRAACACQNLAGQEADDELTTYLLRHCVPLNAPPPPVPEVATPELAALERELAACAHALESLADALECPGLDDALLTKVNLRAHALADQREELLRERERLTRKRTMPGWEECFTNLRLCEQRALLRELLVKVVWDGEDCELFLHENLP